MTMRQALSVTTVVWSHAEDPHYFVAEVLDDLDGDAAGGGAVEGAGGVAVQGFPGFSVDLGLEGGLERLVGIVSAEEVCVADEEARGLYTNVNNDPRKS